MKIDSEMRIWRISILLFRAHLVAACAPVLVVKPVLLLPLTLCPHSIQALYDRLYETLVSKEGYLWKQGKSILHAWTRR